MEPVLSYVVHFQWKPPTHTGGVDVSYVLTLSPPPMSGSIITTQSTACITVSYNIEYNVTITAKNCVGFSLSTLVAFQLISK